MMLAIDDAPFVLQGPKPLIQPSAWEAYGPMALVALVLIVLAIYAVRRFVRRNPTKVAPIVELERALHVAESLPPSEAVALVTRTFRTYLASIEPRAATSLSTEELIRILSELPIFLPARDPLQAALRGADAAKFAGAALEIPLLIAGVREAARRIEGARRLFAKVVAKPLIPVKPPTPKPVVPTLPGPPPLPKRDNA